MDTGDIKRKLGLRLKELRLSKGLRQEDLKAWDFPIDIMEKLSGVWSI